VTLFPFLSLCPQTTHSGESHLQDTARRRKRRARGRERWGAPCKPFPLANHAFCMPCNAMQCMGFFCMGEREKNSHVGIPNATHYARAPLRNQRAGMKGRRRLPSVCRNMLISKRGMGRAGLGAEKAGRMTGAILRICAQNHRADW
jgi:hypothetical protein